MRLEVLSCLNLDDPLVKKDKITVNFATESNHLGGNLSAERKHICPERITQFVHLIVQAVDVGPIGKPRKNDS